MFEMFIRVSCGIFGFQIAARGLQPTSENIYTIQVAPVPTDVIQLKSFLGVANYYGKFLPDLSHALPPLYILVKTCPMGSFLPTFCGLYSQYLL